MNLLRANIHNGVQNIQHFWYWVLKQFILMVTLYINALIQLPQAILSCGITMIIQQTIFEFITTNQMQKRILTSLDHFQRHQHPDSYQNSGSFLYRNFKSSTAGSFQNQNIRFPQTDCLNFGQTSENSSHYIPPPMSFCIQNMNLQYRRLLMHIRSSPHFNPESFWRMKHFLLGCGSFQPSNYPFIPENNCQKQQNFVKQKFDQQNLVKLEQPQPDVINICDNKYQRAQPQKYQSHGPVQELNYDEMSEKAQKQFMRRKKVLAYLQKRKSRTFSKKIIYMCRKNVADNRIRHKGRFINTQQAKAVLGLQKSCKMLPEQLKQLISNLQNKIDKKQKEQQNS